MKGSWGPSLESFALPRPEDALPNSRLSPGRAFWNDHPSEADTPRVLPAVSFFTRVISFDPLSRPRV